MNQYLVVGGPTRVETRGTPREKAWHSLFAGTFKRQLVDVRFIEMASPIPIKNMDTYIDKSVQWYVIKMELGGGSTARSNAPAANSPGIPELPLAACEFCDQKQLMPDVKKTLVLAEQHFTVVGKPAFQVVHDPEYGQHYLCIDVQVIGEPEEVFLQGEAFLESFVALVGRDNQKHISLVYHST